MTNTSEQKIQLECRRLAISDVVLHTRTENLHRMCESFHFDNSDLLEIEFNKYLQEKASYDRAYMVIANLSDKEIDSIMPHIHIGHNVVQQCLKIADQKDQQEKREQRQKRFDAAKRILNPLRYFALLLTNKKKNIKYNTIMHIKSQENR